MADHRSGMQMGKAGRSKRNGELRLQGIGVSPGIAIGPCHILEKGITQVPEYPIRDVDVDDECERFEAAVREATSQLEGLRTKASGLTGAAAEEFGYLMDAHAQMLRGSRLIRSVEAIISSELVNAEAAVQISLAQIAEDFSAIEDPYLAARLADIREVGERILRNLTDRMAPGLEHVVEGAVIVGDEITPSDAALMSPGAVAGFISEAGGAEGHTAIMARSMGLPAILGVSSALDALNPGETIILDGVTGEVILRPEPATLKGFETRGEQFAKEQKMLERLRKKPAVTKDGLRISLQANVELPGEIPAALYAGAEGIGLLRSEFMFMNRETLPSEEEQYAALGEMIVAMKGKPVTVRTLDVGADKISLALAGHTANQANPALGLRAIRLALVERGLLETQLAAILRAACHGPVRILLPMICNVAEIREVRAVLIRVARRLRRQGETVPDPLPPLGVMIEIPAAALAADSLATEADFFSIGTNDLTMYALAIDRGNDQVAHLYDPLHPAVLRLIKMATDAANAADIPVNLCGEMAGDDRLTPLLVGLGLTELSMAATALPRVKRHIRLLKAKEAMLFAEQVMATHRKQEIMELILGTSAK